MCFLTIAPFLYKNTLHLSEDKIGLLMAISSSFYIIGGMCSPALLTRLGINTFLGVASSFSILGGLLLLGIHFMELYNALLITAAFGLYIFFTSLVWGASTSKALQCFDEQRGSASAIRSLLIIGFFTTGSYIGSLINNDNLVDISIVLIVVSVLSTLAAGQGRSKTEACSPWEP